MSYRCLSALLTTIAVVGVTLTPAVAVGQSADPQEPPRTSWGSPNLQGVWDFRSLTPMQRPQDLSDKEFLTAEEVADLEREAIDNNERLAKRPAQKTTVTENVDRGEDGAPGHYNNFWVDKGTWTVSTGRTSLIIDPANGRMPEYTQTAKDKRAALEKKREGLTTHDVATNGWIEDLGSEGLQLRCITGFNSGPPMTPGYYNNNVQVFQTEDYVVLLNEMNHNARIVPLDDRAEIDLPQWTGDARGHWEDDTLVVVTAGFLRETSFDSGRTDTHLRLTERFTRVSADTLVYEATLDDPTVWTEVWTYQIPMQLNDQPMYEYACHEGNYGLTNILAGVRAQEAAETAAGVAQ